MIAQDASSKDYILAGRHPIPEDAAAHQSERIVSLFYSHHCDDGHEADPYEPAATL